MYIQRGYEERIIKILDGQKQCLITGQAGIGKTSIVNNLQNMLSTQVVFLNASRLVNFEIEIYTLTNKFILDNVPFTIIFDDIINLNDFINITSVKRIINYDKSKIIYVSRSKESNIKIPHIQINPFSNEEIKSYLDYYKINNPETINLITIKSQGNPQILEFLARIANGKFKDFDEYFNLLGNDEYNKIILEYTFKKNRPTLKTSEEAKKVLFYIKNFGPISKVKLKKWCHEINIDESLNILVKNKYITFKDDKYIFLTGLKVNETDFNKYINDLINLFTNDTTNKIKDDTDEAKLVNLLSENNQTIMYISNYYKNHENTEALNSIIFMKKNIDEMLGLQKRLVQNDDLILQDTSKLKRNIKELQEQVALQSDIIVQIKNNILQELESQRAKIVDDIIKINSIKELEEIIKKPKKDSKKRALELLNTLGSLASIAGIILSCINFKIKM